MEISFGVPPRPRETCVILWAKEKLPRKRRTVTWGLSSLELEILLSFAKIGWRIACDKKSPRINAPRKRAEIAV